MPRGLTPRLLTQEHKRSVFRAHFEKTAVHEVGHLLNTGFNDETASRGNDLHSGSAADDTPENAIVSGVGKTATWSVTARGWQREYGRAPMNGNYTAGR
jgi:hypothetical protein